MLRSLLVLVCSCLVLGVSHVRAQTLELQWQAPSECPSEGAVRARVAQLLADSAWQTPISADVRIDERSSGAPGQRYTLRLRIEVEGRVATRELSADDCASLTQAAAWLVSLTIDPSLTPPPADEVSSPSAQALPPAVAAAAASKTEPATADPVNTPQDQARPAAAPAAEDEPTSDPAADTAGPASPLHYRIGVYSGVFAAGFAGPAADLGLDLGVDLAQLSFSLFVAQHFSRSRALPASAAAAEFSSQELGALGCYLWGDRYLAGPCLVLSGLRTQGDASGVMDDASRAFLWMSAGASLALRTRALAPLELWLDAGLLLPVTRRPRFEITGLGTAGEAELIGGRVRAGVSLRLP